MTTTRRWGGGSDEGIISSILPKIGQKVLWAELLLHTLDLQNGMHAALLHVWQWYGSIAYILYMQEKIDAVPVPNQLGHLKKEPNHKK